MTSLSTTLSNNVLNSVSSAPGTPRPSSVEPKGRLGTMSKRPVLDKTPVFGASINLVPDLLVDAEATEESPEIGISTVARRTINPIRQIVDRSKVQPNPNKSLISLSLGDPTIFGNLSTHPCVLEAVRDQLANPKAHGYAPSTGFEHARAAIANFHSSPKVKYTSKDVVIASGCSGALDLCISALCDPEKNHNILIPKPAFSLYKTLATSKGLKVKYYELISDQEWEADLASMEANIDQNTTAILINNPSNPCGSVFSSIHLLDILDVCRRHRLPLIADEIYADLVFDSKQHPYIPAASLSTDVPVLTVGGLAKKWLVPGWRIGWILIHDPTHRRFQAVRQGLVSLSQLILGANTLIQCAIPRILGETPETFYEATRRVLRDNAAILKQELGNIPGIRVIEPRGAMYMMLRLSDETDDVAWCEQLLAQESVACLPGSCFNAPHYVRLVFTAPADRLREASHRIRAFVQR